MSFPVSSPLRNRILGWTLELPPSWRLRTQPAYKAQGTGSKDASQEKSESEAPRLLVFRFWIARPWYPFPQPSHPVNVKNSSVRQPGIPISSTPSHRVRTTRSAPLIEHETILFSCPSRDRFTKALDSLVKRLYHRFGQFSTPRAAPASSPRSGNLRYGSLVPIPGVAIHLEESGCAVNHSHFSPSSPPSCPRLIVDNPRPPTPVNPATRSSRYVP